jgi:hypothetical protein
MKSIIRSIARAVWRGLAPVRRPLVRKLDRHLTRAVATEVAGAIEGLEGRIAPALAEVILRGDILIQLANRSAQETDLVLQSLVRELVRVQMQVEALRGCIGRQDPGERTGRAVLDGEDPLSPALRQTA